MRHYLRDLAEIGAGQGAPQGDHNYCNDGLPFVKAGNLQELTSGGSINDIQKVSDEVAKAHKLKLYPKGTVLFAKSGMSCLKGYVYVLPVNAYVVSHLACITPKEDISEYLRLYFTFHRPNQLVKDAAYPSISLTDIGDLEVDTKDEQTRDHVIAVLKSVEEIIELRTKELQRFDDLIKARFIEMFGPPGTDKKGWGLKRLGDCCSINPKKSKDGRLTSGLEVSFVPMPAITENGAIDVSEKKLFDEVKTGFTYFSEHDVLMAKITPCMENGKGAVAVGLTNGIGFGSTEFHVLRPLDRVSNPYWIYSLTSFKTFRHDAASNMTGSAGQRRVPAAFLESYKVSLPPIELQNEFADFVKRVNKSKVVVQKALDEAQLLFDSLMQEYFG